MEEQKYSIAEARNQFAAIVRDAEKTNQPVQVTRRGQPVAVILSAEEYARLIANQPKQDFWTAYLEWRKKWNVDELDMDPDEIWGDVRDRTPAADTNPWQ
ncbi:MAG: type II toxin-antitoxin system Phd/YefM family antitoxin [Chloroflexi bacterium]|nr:MAG: type II toxin-antitoxin system Phd/YefM family antitoxin [Chloroflexota bacterium]